ncbi:MAG: response regulator, partial [Cytophagaceae bacterium]
VSRLWRNTIGIGFLATLIIAGLVVSRQRLKIRNDQVLLIQSSVVADKNLQLEVQTTQLEQQAVILTNQAHKLQELDEAKSRFFTNVTHEFRTPLTLILGTLSNKLHQLAGNEETTIREGEVTVMHRNAQRLLQLINQLLDLSKIESGQLQLSLHTDDIKPLVTLLTALFSSLADQRHIQFAVSLSSDQLPVSHDADQLEKVITNLLSNAFKFTPDGGHISVSANSTTIAGEPFVQLIIDDTGIGIATADRELVFERFYQGTHAQADRQPGTGIGLSLVKEIVHRHNGTIRIEDKPDQGTRVVVLLPQASSIPADIRLSDLKLGQPITVFQATEPRLIPEPLPVNQGVDNRPLVLVVEDNADVRAFICDQMRVHYRVLESKNGLLGLTMAQENVPDLIISDWMMPDMGGVELCRRIKTDERTCHIPFILVTALSTQGNRLAGLETGADDYLTKPFDSRELLIRTQNLIANRRQLHERFSREIRVQPKDITVTSADEKFLLRVLKIVDENLGNSDFSVEQFGHDVGLSRMQLHRKLMALTGQAAGDFIRQMRLKRAAQLLGCQSATVSEIAYEVGFNSLSYFAKCFREQFGVAPNEYYNQQTETA